jgi:hypothetical protein
VLAAFFSATAAGTKYLGLFFVPTALVVLMVSSSARERSSRLWAFALFCAVALLTILPVYARITYYTGNPLFPFLPRIFGSTLWDPVPSPYATIAAKLMATITLPWTAVFTPAAVGRQAPLSPFVLLLLPLMLFAPIKRSMRPILIACLIFAFAVPPDARYLVVILPIVCVALSLAFEWVSQSVFFATRLRTLESLSVAICCGVMLLPGWLYVNRAIVKRGMPPVGEAQRDAFLERQFPVYRAIECLNRTHGRRFTVYAVHAENMMYWADGILLGDWSGPASFGRVLPLATDPPRLFCKLRALGADYLLVTKGHDDFAPAVERPEFAIRFRSIYEDKTSVVFALSSTNHGCPSTAQK